MTCVGCAKRREQIKAWLRNPLKRKGALRMDFAHWANSHEFFKPDTAEAFQPLWAALLRAGLHIDDVRAKLDRVVGAMKNEYGE